VRGWQPGERRRRRKGKRSSEYRSRMQQGVQCFLYALRSQGVCGIAPAIENMEDGVFSLCSDVVGGCVTDVAGSAAALWSGSVG